MNIQELAGAQLDYQVALNMGQREEDLLINGDRLFVCGEFRWKPFSPSTDETWCYVFETWLQADGQYADYERHLKNLLEIPQDVAWPKERREALEIAHRMAAGLPPKDQALYMLIHAPADLRCKAFLLTKQDQKQ